jgi:tRNA A-37 threonylcarbamoyl transferase component Bud32
MLTHFSFYTIFLLFFSHANSKLNAEEQAILLNLKQHWQNPQPLRHWTPSNSASHCYWPEITCTDGSVTGISLPNMNITGTVPPFICDLNNLTAIDLSYNYMTSNGFPTAFYNCSKLVSLDVSQNNFVGKVPDDIHRMSRLRHLNIGGNNFSGNIPASIGQLTELRILQLSACQFNGSFPPEIGNLSNLERLELAYMKTIMPARSGSIPSEFENGAYASSFLNNPRLCANKPSLNIAEWNSKTQNSSKTSSKLLAWIIGVPAAAFLGLVASFLVIRIYRKIMHALDLAWKLTSFQRMNFTKFDILSGLTENNVIGCGGSGKVYCVSINPSRDCVAVKRIWSDKKLEQKLEKEFLAEVKILSSIRHSNIVKLLCCISSDNSKLLVYEYLENRSLDLWLNRKSRATTASGSVHNNILDWPQRLKIAVGAAQGLSYMHHDCSPPIVHRDLKSSNILLDSEFNAKIADFGVAKMLMKEGESATMSAVDGSYGYIAPGEMYGVFKLGIICTGASPLTRPSMKEVFNDHSKLLVYEYLENRSLDLWLHGKSTRAMIIYYYAFIVFLVTQVKGTSASSDLGKHEVYTAHINVFTAIISGLTALVTLVVTIWGGICCCRRRGARRVNPNQEIALEPAIAEVRPAVAEAVAEVRPANAEVRLDVNEVRPAVAEAVAEVRPANSEVRLDVNEVRPAVTEAVAEVRPANVEVRLCMPRGMELIVTMP